ncbi:uncharacterized protein LOC117315532 [Pecten maximus]|uniref:uncharacterized protein LOC117315532 n=1 Tax=Pecten maximus TaxID=6579 RepID=UPI001458AFC6|nr:uncharacterized protein LOC117315532 [Pecten maximus]
MTDRRRLGKCTVISQEGDLSNRRKESASDTGSFHHSDISDLTDFIDKREGNATCSETLKSLSKHGAKEYISLSAKKSKASRKNKTADKLNSCGDTEVIANSATEKPPHRNVSKTQKKSVILTGQRSVSELKGKRKRKASGKYDGEKRPLKRVRLLDRFWDDDEQSSNSGSVYFSTVDLNPNTNGGLLQSFDIDHSKKSWRSGQTKVRIKQGQFIRTKTMEVYKSLEQKACESKQIVTGKKDRNFASTDNSSNVCVRSNSKTNSQKEFGQHGSNNTQILQNTHPNFSKHSDYDLTSNVKPSQTLCPTDQKCQPEKLSNNDETFNRIKKGAESDKSFHQNLEGKCQMHAEVTPKLSKETIQKTNMRGDNSIGENHIGSSSVQNNIPQTLISKCDNCKDSDSEDGKEAETIFSKNGGTRGQTFCNDEGLRRKSSNYGVNESGTNRHSSCEPIIYESEGYYDYGGDNESDLSNSDTSDDDSQPLVLYQQSCRTLPLCALLNLARCQKLEHDLSKKKDSERENNLKTSGSPVSAKGTQLSDVQVDLHCDENIASEKIEEFALLPQDVDESPSKTRLMSGKDMDVSSEEIPEHHFNTNLLDRNAVGIENVTKYVQVDRQESVSGSDSPFLPAELPKFKCGSDSNSLSSAPAKSVSGSHSVSLPPEPAKSVSGSHSVSLPPEPAKSVSGSHSVSLPPEPAKSVSGSHSVSLPPKPAKSVSGSHSVSLPPEPAKSVSGSDFASLPTEPAYSISVLEPAPAEPLKSEKSSRLWNSVHEEKAVLMSTDRVKSDLPFEKLERTLCDVEQQGNSIKDQLKSNSVCDPLTQESDTNRSNWLPITERPLYNGSSSSVIKRHEEDRVSKLIVDSDFQKSPKLSKVTEDICSLKSIADDNCIEISRSVIQQCSISVNSDHEASVKPAVQEMSGEDEGHRMLEKNKPHLTVESDDVLNDMVDKCFDNNSVDDVTSDDSQIRNSVMSTYTDKENSVSMSTELKLGFRHIEVPQRLPKNLMSTCNVVGSFADDMVTGITIIIDTETHSSNSSSVFSKYHDYCARQISYQNFLEWKLQESVHKECSLDNDMCARSLAYQDFQRTKCQDLLSSEKYLGEMDLTTNFQDTDSQNSEMKMAPMDDNVDKGVITQTDKMVDLNREQLAVRQADDTFAVTRNFEQSNVRKADDTVTKIWEPGMREADNTIGKKDTEMNVRTVLNDEAKDDVSVENCDSNDSQNSHASDQKDLNDIRKNPSFCVTNLVPTDLYQTEHILMSESSSNIEVQSKKQQTVLPDNEMNSVDMSSVAVLTVEGESSEDENDFSINIEQVDTCARVLPFETNIMHKFSNKTKLLFQEYHNRQQTSQDISSDDTDEKYPEHNLTIDNHTQTVSSMEENECSMYEMHMLGELEIPTKIKIFSRLIQVEMEHDQASVK